MKGWKGAIRVLWEPLLFVKGWEVQPLSLEPSKFVRFRKGNSRQIVKGSWVPSLSFSGVKGWGVLSLSFWEATPSREGLGGVPS